MSDQFIGEVRAFSFSFPPREWLACNGQTLLISQFSPLFALIGTTYGGDGKTNFKLPDLNGRVAMGPGTGPDGTIYTTGQALGENAHTLLINEIPAHNHTINASAKDIATATNIPGGTAYFGSASTDQVNNPTVKIYNISAPNTPLGTPLTPGATASQAHENRMPTLVMNYCIAFSGEFPSR